MSFRARSHLLQRCWERLDGSADAEPAALAPYAARVAWAVERYSESGPAVAPDD